MPSEAEKKQAEQDRMLQRFGYFRGVDDKALHIYGTEGQKELKRRLKKRYMAPELDFENMFKQSCARVNFMKTRRTEFHAAGTPQWLSYPTAEKYLSQFKYHRTQNADAEQFWAAAVATKRDEDAEKYKEEANAHLSKCLFAHYVIGKLYTEFIDGRKMPSFG